jgi:putative transposase of IS4/5 family DUF4096/AAA ATPase-like protein
VSTGPGRAVTLVGRDAELALLAAELDRARTGEPRCVALLGEPGIGKTRLARELAGRGGWWSSWPRAHLSGATTPFGLWSEAFERHLRGLERPRVSELCSGFLDDLLLDDVHLADASSWEALSYLARSLTDARVLVVATARPAELAAQPVGTEVLLGLEQEGLAGGCAWLARRWRDHRTVIDGILWKLRTGAPWRDLPERYGPWTTCHDRYVRRRDGTWDRLLGHAQTKAEAVGQVE